MLKLLLSLNTSLNFSKKLPILTRCQVLVVGGGPAGLSAAIISARCGVDTLLLISLVVWWCYNNCWNGNYCLVSYEGTTDCTGIGIEMEKIAIKWEDQ